MNRSYKVSELQDLSDLHVLAISQASFDLVRLAHKKNPQALTDKVLLDAFLCGARPEVLRFLVEKKGSNYKEIGDFVGKTFLAAIPFLKPGRNSGEHLLHLTELVNTFPEYLVNQYYESTFCALSIVLFSTSFPRNMLDSLTRALPHGEPFFILLDDDDLPLDEKDFASCLRTSLDTSRCLQAIGDILEKVKQFRLRRINLSAYELSKILPMLFRKINATKKVHLDFVQGDPPADETPVEGWRDTMIAAAKEELEKPKGDCPIEEFSITYCAHEEWEMPAQPDFSFHSLLYSMDHLQRVDISIIRPWKATQEICNLLCDLLGTGSLDTLVVAAETETRGLFLPLLESAAGSKSLTYLRLQRLCNLEEVEIYQDKILEILKTNTKLFEAVFSGTTVTDDTILEDNLDAVRTHMNKEWFLDGTKGNDKQRRIDYYTILNYCNRKIAKADSTSLEGFLECLSTAFLREHLEFLGFTGKEEQELVTMMQHGLLSEKPSLWAPNGGGKAVGTVQLKRKGDNLMTTRRRKRKAPSGAPLHG